MYKLSEQLVKEYAELAIKVGVNVQKGQMLIINAPVEAYELTRACVKVAYEAGASRVLVNHHDDINTRTDFECAELEALKKVPQWSLDRYQFYIDNKACFLHIVSDDPDLLNGIDKDRIKEVRMENMKAMQKYQYYTMNNIGQWSIIAYPNMVWAKKVFPEDSDEVAYEKLWKAILSTSRIEEFKTIDNWAKHNAEIKERCNKLNAYNFKSLHFKNSLGTDLTVGLIKDHIWEGGCDKCRGNDAMFNPNIPSEEIFTMPDRYHIDGTVVSTKPLSYSGNLIPEFSLTFKDGRVIDHSAKENCDVLTALLDTDEGSRSLGEVALISYDSPISSSGILFYDTLFDENASCHLALGACYPTNIKGGADMSQEELYELGGNDSMNHVDFMFGSSDMEVVGETDDGQKIQVFANGNFII